MSWDDGFLGARASRPHQAWHSLGHLPHMDQPGTAPWLSFGLADPVPAHRVAACGIALKLSGSQRDSMQARRPRSQAGYKPGTWFTPFNNALIIPFVPLRGPSCPFVDIFFCLFVESPSCLFVDPLRGYLFPSLLVGLRCRPPLPIFFVDAGRPRFYDGEDCGTRLSLRGQGACGNISTACL